MRRAAARRTFAMHLLQALAVVGLLAANGLHGCHAQGEAPLQAGEYRIKAAFLYKFASYVEWPAGTFRGPDSPLVFGVLGADELADDLSGIAAGHTVNGRPVEVRRLRPGDSLAGLQVLFAGRAATDTLPDVLAAAKGQALLTVTESGQALELGSTINFVIVENKVRFDVALPPRGRDNVRISARLLSVARRVITKPS